MPAQRRYTQDIRLRRRLWANTVPTPGERFVPAGTITSYINKCWRYGHDALNQSWVNVGRPSVTLAHIQRGVKHNTVTQYWANAG